MALSVKKTVTSFEDILATDALFVEYFNAFLALPCFPEPVVFNRENDVFELGTAVPRVLAARIKAAVREVRQRRKPAPMYRVAHLHSFRNMPLTNVQPPLPAQPMANIETAFTVQTLNREQGIEWVRAERLPTFLTSQHYAEFQLAKLISQAKVSVAPSRVIGVIVDPTGTQSLNCDAHNMEEALLTRLEIMAEDEERGEEEKEEGKKKIDKDDEVAVARTADDGTQTVGGPEDEMVFDVNDAKTKNLMDSMYVSFGDTPVTESVAWMSQASRTREPTFCCPSTDGRPLSAVLPSYGLPRSADMPDMQSYLPADMSTSVTELHDVCGNTPVPVMPLPPRAYRTTCSIEETDTVLPADERIRQYESIAPDCMEPLEPIPPTPPLPTCDRERAQVKMDAMSTDIETMGMVVVATVLKYAISTISGLTLEAVESSDQFQDLLPDMQYANLTRDSLYRMELLPLSEPTVPHPLDQKDAATPIEDDTLFLSDDEEEDERDAAVFRAAGRGQKRHTYPLTQRRGIEQLKRYLEGTTGEKNWRLWVDIEKLKYSADCKQLQQSIRQLREMYHTSAAPYKLNLEVQRKYGLSEASSWCLRKLVSLQPVIAKSLILYWAPRYLLSLSSKVCPDKYLDYRTQKATLRTPVKDSYPTPPQPGMGLVPLRPKSCIAGGRRPPPAEPVVDVPQRPSTAVMRTHPPTGMHRDYSLPELFLTPSQKKQKQRELEQRQAAIAGVSGVPTTMGVGQACVTPKCLLIGDGTAASDTASVTKSTHEPPPPQPVTTEVTPATPETSPTEDAKRPTIPPTTPAGMKPPLSTTGASQQQIEALLQALDSEKLAGGYFRNFLHVSKNKLWKDSLSFWQDLQKYHEMFYSQTLDPAIVELKARVINAKYIAVRAPYSIAVSPPVRDSIQRHLIPPFEELFDEAEEYVLSLLFDAWKMLIVRDTHSFKKVQLSEVDREINRSSHYVTALQKKGLIKEPKPDIMMCVAGMTELDSTTGELVYDPAAWKSVPEEFRDCTLSRLLHNRVERDHLTAFLASRYASADLACWNALDALKRIDHTKTRERDAAARSIKTTYLNKKYFFGPSSPAGRKGQEKVIALAGGWGKLLNSVLPTDAMIEVEKYVEERLQNKWLPLFLSSEAFIMRQRPKSSIDNIVEDLMLQRKKRSQAIWKLLESKWVTSANDILAFRKALTNPVTSMQFRRFVAVKGDSLETDILFWQEIQKYKELCHLHSDISLIHQKTAAIINCFVDSPVPPSIQVDITSDMADHIIENKLDANPYLFREAQLTVFRVLFGHWQDFCMFRTGVTDESVMATSERNRIRGQILEEQRRAERPPSADLIAEEDEDELSEVAGEGSRRGSEMSRDAADARSWSYSQYVNAFEREDMIDATNVDTFSAAALNVAEDVEERTDVEIVMREGSASELNRKKSLSESRRSLKDEDMGISEEEPRRRESFSGMEPQASAISFDNSDNGGGGSTTDETGRQR